MKDHKRDRGPRSEGPSSYKKKSERTKCGRRREPESANVGEDSERTTDLGPRKSEFPRVKVQRDHGPLSEGPKFRIEKI